tara:strand:- start:2041 stop:4161 length:2121 start_codon:yes stop_codon:yes gene_type:complete
MQKFFLVLSFFLTHTIIFSQSRGLEGKIKAQEGAIIEETIVEVKDTLTNVSKDLKGKVKAQEGAIRKETEDDILDTSYYKIFYLDGRVEPVDTSLTIYKDYNFNFLRQDIFELLKMPNVGQSYNKLGYNFNNKFDYPKLGAGAKHLNYYEEEDIGYYNVPTPFTEIYARSTFEQGQVLDALVSINLSPEFNFTIAHKGYKSLGKYVNTKSRGNQFRLSTNFNSKNKKSIFKFHLTSQNLFNQENGGLTADGIYFFEQAPNYFVLDDFGNQIENEDGSFEMIEYDGYLDRSRLPSILFSESSFYSKRVFLDFNRSLIYNNEKDISTLSVGAQFKHEYKKIEYNDTRSNGVFGEVYEGINVSDKYRYNLQKSSIYVKSNLDKIGRLKINLSNINSNNKFKEYQIQNSKLGNKVDNKQSIFQVEFDKKFKYFELEFEFNKSLRKSFISDYVQLSFLSNSIKNLQIKFNALNSKLSPNLNYILYRSAYKDYNWYNPNLKNQEVFSLSTELSYKDLIKLSGEYNSINNYTFFRELTNALSGEMDLSRKVVPNQIDSEIKYLKIKLFSKVDFGNFSFVNTGQYQRKDQELLIDGLATLNVPEWITRNTLMYSKNVFNNSLYIQTGITFNYFTKFYADYYNPLISEFVTQNYKEIGNYPRFDFFFNAKIQQTRVFIKVEHLNSSFTGYDFYSDIFNPYRDLSVRLGLVWNFFQ